MNKKPVGLLNVLLNAAAAIVWTINCVVLVLYTRGNEPPAITLVLDIICAIIWWVAFAVVLVRYYKGKHNE